MMPAFEESSLIRQFWRLVFFALGCCILFQRDPELFFWRRVLLEAWGTKAKKPHISKELVVCWPSRVAEGGKPQKTLFF